MDEPLMLIARPFEQERRLILTDEELQGRGVLELNVVTSIRRCEHPLRFSVERQETRREAEPNCQYLRLPVYKRSISYPCPILLQNNMKARMEEVVR
jgi:hypothetical protein